MFFEQMVKFLNSQSVWRKASVETLLLTTGTKIEENKIITN